MTENHGYTRGFDEDPAAQIEVTALTYVRRPHTTQPANVSTISSSSFNQPYFPPSNGLDFMRNVNQLIIQQSVELTDLMASVSSENRYTVKIPARETNEAIYYATESSDSLQRTCFGSGRGFNMRLYDRSQQEVVSFKRRLACGTCAFWPYLQKMEIWIPPGELVGRVSQRWHFIRTLFEVSNRHDEVLYRIEGPNSFGCLLGESQVFQIFTVDGATQIGSIVHQWDPTAATYNILLQIPSSITDNRHKALLLGCAFLLEYMFFESAKKKSCHRCFC